MGKEMVPVRTVSMPCAQAALSHFRRGPSGRAVRIHEQGSFSIIEI